MTNKVHFNNAMNPEMHVLPACMIGLIGHPKVRPEYRGATDKGEATCVRCLKIMGPEKETAK